MSDLQVQAIDTNLLSLDHAQQGGNLNTTAAQVAGTVLAGLYLAQTGGYSFWSTLDWNSFDGKVKENHLTGLQLVSIDTNQEGPSTTFYTGCWTQASGPSSYLWRTTDWSEFTSKFNQLASTQRLLDFDIEPTEGNRFFTGTWGSTPISQTIVADLNWDDFTTQWRALTARGLRLTKIQAFQTAGAWHMTGLFEQGTGGHAFYMLSDWNAFLQKIQEYQGLEVVDFQVYDDNGTRWYIGVWRETSKSHKFIFGLDWGSFINQWNTLSSQGMRLQKAIRYSNAVEVPVPQWDRLFRSKLVPIAQGFAYEVFHNGQTVATGVNNARSTKDPPQKTWSSDTRINLASVSKSITAVAVLKLIADLRISIDDPFYSHVKSQFPVVGRNVDKVRIRDLLTMKSGMAVDGTLYTSNYWTFLSQYLQNQSVPDKQPGTEWAYAYSNTNFTILQALIDCLTGHAGQLPSYYITYVSDKVLKPMSIDLRVFNTQPDAPGSSALYYNGPADPNRGTYFQPIQCVAAGGWVSSARELIKFLTGVRKNTVLSASTTLKMLEDQLGWYKYDGIFGQYFHHNGGLWNGDPLAQGLKTGIIHFSDGYDAVLLVNTYSPDPIQTMIDAFETRD